jgi:uncharacterized protein
MKWTEFSFILNPSPISGIGVFATHEIPAGTPLFTADFSPAKRQIKDIPSEFRRFCIYLNDEECLAPKRFDCMEIGWYINHSHEPNITKHSEGHLISLCDIKAGDEILIDYNELNEPEHMKEDYYKKNP